MTDKSLLTNLVSGNKKTNFVSDNNETDACSPGPMMSRTKKPRPRDRVVDKLAEAANAKVFSALIRTPLDEADMRALVAQLKVSEWLPERPVPRTPCFPTGLTIKARLESIQKYISSLEYNHTGTDYFSVRKNRGMKRICSTAREIIREALPIKCVEAVFLGAYLTAGMKHLTRIPVRLHSRVNGYSFRHIVLVVRIGSGASALWGALGLSRQTTLMYKPFVYKSLSSLICDYNEMYEAVGHCVHHVGVGLPLTHDMFSIEPIHWRPLVMRPEEVGWPMVCCVVDQYASKIETVTTHVQATGSLPDEFHAYANHNYGPKNVDEDKGPATEGERKASSGAHKKRKSQTIAPEPRKTVDKSNAAPTEQTREDRSTSNAGEDNKQSSGTVPLGDMTVGNETKSTDFESDGNINSSGSGSKLQDEQKGRSGQGGSSDHVSEGKSTMDEEGKVEGEESSSSSTNSTSCVSRADVAFLSV